MAQKHVTFDGIDFTAIKRATRGFDETSRHIVDIAHNLFSWNSKCKVTPFDISRLGYPYMEQVCNALFIAFDQYEIVLDAKEEQVSLSLDRSSYEETKQIHRRMDELYEKMLVTQVEEETMEMGR